MRAQAWGALRPGDVLKIASFRDKELTGRLPRSTRAATCRFRDSASIKAAGLEPTEVTDRLRLALIERGFARPENPVQPLIRVSVLGEVRSPNVYPVDPGTSLLQSLTVRWRANGPRAAPETRASSATVARFSVDMDGGLHGNGAGAVVLYSNELSWSLGESEGSTEREPQR
jgi:protein involved in polysaccharide export with SLBB domain